MKIIRSVDSIPLDIASVVAYNRETTAYGSTLLYNAAFKGLSNSHS